MKLQTPKRNRMSLLPLLLLLLLQLLPMMVPGVKCDYPPEEEHHQQEEEEVNEIRTAIVFNQMMLQKLLTDRPVPEPTCPYPYTKVVNECFYLSKKKYPWEKARTHCRGMGGDLATPVHVYALDSFIIRSEVGTTDVWVGGRKTETGGWLWFNNKTVKHVDWYPTLPGARPNHNCLYLHSNKDSPEPPVANYLCSTAFNFACQYTI